MPQFDHLVIVYVSRNRSPAQQNTALGSEKACRISDPMWGWVGAIVDLAVRFARLFRIARMVPILKCLVGLSLSEKADVVDTWLLLNIRMIFYTTL